METIEIKEYQKGEEAEISELIKRVYTEYVAPDYSDKGNEFFYEWIKSENILARQEKQRQLWIAKIGKEIIGVIEMRENTYVSLLFVDKRYQKMGVAKQLLDELIKACKQRDPEKEKIKVHASPYSIEIYKRLGFKNTDIMQEENGIKYMPMEKKIK